MRLIKTLLGFLLVPWFALSQGIDQPVSTIDAGGGKSSSNSFSSTTSMGEPAAQSDSGGGFSNNGGFIPAEQSSSLSTSVTNQYGVTDRWNLLSVPLTMSDYARSSLYPTAISAAFAYEAGYVTKTTLANGIGYWLKFNGNQAVEHRGHLRNVDTIVVHTGWNLIGSISSQVNVSAIASEPPGIVTSRFFGYAGSYAQSSVIEPGQAYWVKVNQNGNLVLSMNAKASAVNRIRIVAGSEAPPSPPPSAPATNSSRAVPEEFALLQNYPNPFNPVTVIRYDVPVESKVMLRIYNSLGQEVRTLVDGIQEPGYESMEWNSTNNAGNDVSSGVYFYRIDAISIANASMAFTQVQKLILLR